MSIRTHRRCGEGSLYQRNDRCRVTRRLSHVVKGTEDTQMMSQATFEIFYQLSADDTLGKRE